MKSLLVAALLPCVIWTRMVIPDWNVLDLDEPSSLHAKARNLDRFSRSDPFLGEKYHSGFINVDRAGGEMFYWYFPSRKEKSDGSTPFLVWLTGGPGCSSELAALTENGPLTMYDNGTLKRNPFSWTEVADVVYIDQPLGTGFSEAGDPRNYVTNEKKIAADMREFLVQFIELYPWLKARPFYITGESYAGHYIPSVAHALLVSPVRGLDMKGIALGNAWVDPASQYPAYALYAFEHSLINEAEFQAAKKGLQACVKLIDKGIWPLAFFSCNAVVAALIKGRNPYDIRLDCNSAVAVQNSSSGAQGPSSMCYNMTSLTNFMNRPDVQNALGANKSWKECSPLVYALLLSDWSKQMGSKVSELLQAGVQILIYSGDQDYICNWRGGKAWTENVSWAKQQEFADAEFIAWKVGLKEAGELKKIDNLTFLRIYDAGHMVPMDQPVVALTMISQFLSGILGADVQDFREKEYQAIDFLPQSMIIASS